MTFHIFFIPFSYSFRGILLKREIMLILIFGAPIEEMIGFSLIFGNPQYFNDTEQ